MRVGKFSFGSICIDGTTYEHDVVIDRGEVRKRKKKPSKKFRGAFGQTPLSLEEKMPWKCRRLVILCAADTVEVAHPPSISTDSRVIGIARVHTVCFSNTS